MHSNGLHLVL